MSVRLLSYADVAACLAVTRSWLHRNRRALAVQHGFPPPVPGMGLRWDPLAIDAWLATQRQENKEKLFASFADEEEAKMHRPLSEAEQIADERAELSRRAAALGRGRRAA